jgi:hypothetical protein
VLSSYLVDFQKSEAHSVLVFRVLKGTVAHATVQTCIRLWLCTVVLLACPDFCIDFLTSQLYVVNCQI